MFAFVLTFVIFKIIGFGIRIAYVGTATYPRKLEVESAGYDFFAALIHAAFAAWGLFLIF